MKYSWLLVIIALAAIVVFNKVLVPARTNFTSAIILEPFIPPSVVKQNNREALVAKVYSTYPFNHRDYLMVAAGAADGVQPGMAVTADGNYLLGQVTEVFDRYSTIRTIFDQNWSLSVRAGDQGENALLISGQQPGLTMIDKKSVLKTGDSVYSASRDFPYGLKIGSVGEVTDSSAAAFRQAALEFPYPFNDLQEVAILIK